MIRPTIKTREINHAMGEWLQTLAPWDVFFTGTWSRPVTVNGAFYGARRYLDIVEKWAGQPVYGFVGVERGRSGGLLHVHGLLGNVAHMRLYCDKRLGPDQWGLKCCLLHAWPWGYARVLPYEPKLGAAHYVSKYVTKELSEWDLRNLPAVPQKALPLNTNADSAQRRGMILND